MSSLAFIHLFTGPPQPTFNSRDCIFGAAFNIKMSNAGQINFHSFTKKGRATGRRLRLLRCFMAPTSGHGQDFDYWSHSRNFRRMMMMVEWRKEAGIRNKSSYKFFIRALKPIIGLGYRGSIVQWLRSPHLHNTFAPGSIISGRRSYGGGGGQVFIRSP